MGIFAFIHRVFPVSDETQPVVYSTVGQHYRLCFKLTIEPKSLK
jgi:hypothetical protein